MLGRMEGIGGVGGNTSIPLVGMKVAAATVKNCMEVP